MVNDINKQKIAVLFQKYVDANEKLRIYIDNSKSYLNKIKGVEIVSSSMLDKEKALFNFTKKDDLSKSYDVIMLDVSTLMSDMDELTELLKKDTDDTRHLFNSIEFENIASLKIFEDRCIHYNKEERFALNKIFTKVPGLMELESRVFSLSEQLDGNISKLFEQSAKVFVQHFVELYNLISTKNKESINKESLFNALVMTILYLDTYRRQTTSLTQNWTSSFITACNEVDVPRLHKGVTYKVGEFKKLRTAMGVFLNNFSSATNSTGMAIINDLSKFKDKLGIDERNFMPTKPYSDANEDYVLDKFFKGVLITLFNGIKFDIEDKKNVNMKDLVKHIIKEKTNKTDLYKTFLKQFNDLSIKISGDKKFIIKSSKSIDSLGIKLNAETNLIKFMDLKNKNNKMQFFENLYEEDCEFLVELMEKIIKEKAFYDIFLSLNDSQFDKRTNSSVGTDVGDEWFTEGIDYDNLPDLKLTMIITELETTISSLSSSDNLTWEKQWSTDGKSSILDMIKNIAFCINRDSNEYNNYIDFIFDLKSSYDSLDRSIVSYKDLTNKLETLTNTLNIINRK